MISAVALACSSFSFADAGVLEVDEPNALFFDQALPERASLARPLTGYPRILHEIEVGKTGQKASVFYKLWMRVGRCFCACVFQQADYHTACRRCCRQ